MLQPHEVAEPAKLVACLTSSLGTKLDWVTRAILRNKATIPAAYVLGEVDFNAILGILLLRTMAEGWQLKWLTTLPDVLDGLELFIAADALR